MPPAEWPQVTLGGRSYTVKAGMLANYELSKVGIDPADALNLIRNANDPKNFARVIDAWRACTAHEFVLANPKQEIPSAESWIATIEADPANKLAEIATAVGRAIVKWLLAQQQTAAAVPAETPAAETPTPTPTPQAVN